MPLSQHSLVPEKHSKILDKMSEKPNKVSETNTAVNKKFSVPVQLTDLSVYDDAFVFMKERFAAEMMRIDEEMTRLSTNLLRLNGHTTTVQASMTSSNRENPATSWDVIAKSPLVEGEGQDKVLKLQFDVRRYHPHEVSVKILDGTLLVSAVHQERTDADTVYREYNRLSKDGILTVRVPLHLGAEDSEAEYYNLSENDD